MRSRIDRTTEKLPKRIVSAAVFGHQSAREPGVPHWGSTLIFSVLVHAADLTAKHRLYLQLSTRTENAEVQQQRCGKCLENQIGDQ